MAWHWTGDKPLSEPMLTQFTDAYMRAQGGDDLSIKPLWPSAAIWNHVPDIYKYNGYEL